MPRILLLVPNATYRAGAFVSAAKKLPYEVTIASEDPSSLSELLPDDLIAMDFSDAGACVSTAQALAARHEVSAVIAVDDQVTYAAACVAEALGLPGNPPFAVAATRDKLLTRKRLQAGGVEQPGFLEYELAAEALPDVRFPCVVKPRAMSASRGVTRADDPGQLQDALQRVRTLLASEPRATENESVLIEDYVPGWEVAVEGIVSGGRLDIFTIFDKPDPLEGPHFAESIYVTPTRLDARQEQAVHELTQRAVQAIGLENGPIHAEVRGDGRQLWFIEIAARSIGGYCSKVLRFDGRLSLEDVIVAHALSPGAAPPNREAQAAGVLMMQAPVAGRFVTMEGAERVRALAGVEELIVSAHAGQIVKPLPEGFLYVGFVFARGDRPDAVESTLRLARETLAPVIERV